MSLDEVDEPALRAAAMVLLGWSLEFRGEIGRALIWQEKALALAESHDESVYRGYALWSLGVGWWRHRKPDRAERATERSASSDATWWTTRARPPPVWRDWAWIAAEKHDGQRAALFLWPPPRQSAAPWSVDGGTAESR